MINKVILVGNVGGEPDYRVLDGGVKTATIRIATTERYKKDDGTWNEQVEWHTVVAWRNLADIVDKYVRKGDRLYIEGSLHYRTYTDKENIERKVTTITAKELKMLSSKESVVKENLTTAPTQAPVSAQPTAPAMEMPPMPTMSDEMPF